MKSYISLLSRLCRRWMVPAAGILAALALDSCKDDETGEFYLRLYDSPEALVLDQNGGRQEFVLHTNVGDWQVRPEFDEDLSWMEIWPMKGRDDGRFTIEVKANKTAFDRLCDLQIVSGGKVVQIIPVRQQGAEPSLVLDFSADCKRVSATGETFDIGVIANTGWKAEVLGDASGWIHLTEATEQSQSILVDKNETDGERTGVIRFSAPQTSLSVTLQVLQFDPATDFAYAQKTDIAALLAKVPSGGEITDNLYIEAYVISNRAKCAFDAKTMFVQDASGHGLWIEFSSEKENTYNLNDCLTLHMYGSVFQVEQPSTAMKVVNFTASSVKKQEASQGIEPIRVASLAELADYENTLVRLEKVEFVMPYGTYVNIDEDYYGKTNGSPGAAEFNDGTSEYGHFLRDTKGNLAKLYTSIKFMDRFAALMPEGSGPLTGIVIKRRKNNVVSPVIHLRSHEDNQVLEDPATRISKTLLQFGPWTTVQALTSVTASVGTGSIRTTNLTPNVATKGGSTSLYWQWSYARHHTAALDANGKGTPAYKRNVSIQYISLGAQNWWNANGSMIKDQPGGAWMISTSMTDVTGHLSMVFNNMSTNTGPLKYTVEWAEDETAPAADWKYIGEYLASEYQSGYQLMQYVVPLPDELRGKSKVVIRMRVTENICARNNGTKITMPSGLNMISYLRISEL